MDDTYTKKEVILDKNGDPVDFDSFISRKDLIKKELAEAQATHDREMLELTEEARNLYAQFPEDVPLEVKELFNL